MSLSERVQLEDIRDSIVAAPGNLAVTGAQKQEFDLRPDAHANDSASTRSWEDVCVNLGKKENDGPRFASGAKLKRT